MIRVGVVGAAGRMGAMVCNAVAADPQLDLVAAFDPHGGSNAVIEIATDLDSFVEAAVDVAIDFTFLEAARVNLDWLATNGIHAVVGTTGFTDDDLNRLRAGFTSSNCLIAPNFAITAVLMMRLSELAAPFFDTVEIIELHHDNKVDAPSGTAMMTAERIASSSGDWADDPTTTEVVPGVRGGTGPGGIPMHAVRMRGMVAHQEVIFGAEGQTLTLRQDSYDRSSFMPGVILAVKNISTLPGLTLGLDALLDV